MLWPWKRIKVSLLAPVVCFCLIKYNAIKLNTQCRFKIITAWCLCLEVKYLLYYSLGFSHSQCQITISLPSRGYTWKFLCTCMHVYVIVFFTLSESCTLVGLYMSVYRMNVFYVNCLELLVGVSMYYVSLWCVFKYIQKDI